jgi:hypothetical protein
MTHRNFIPAMLLSLALAVPAWAAPASTAITAEQVAAAISSTGAQTTPAQVTLLSNVVATTPAPRLKVESIERWGDQKIKVRLNCIQADQCLPFFVAVQWSQAQAVPPEFADPSSVASHRAMPGSRFVLHAGSPAILLLEGDHIHIQTPVICLESGAPGQTIHVASKDRKLTYTVQVIDGTAVKGNL